MPRLLSAADPTGSSSNRSFELLCIWVCDREVAGRPRTRPGNSSKEPIEFERRPKTRNVGWKPH